MAYLLSIETATLNCSVAISNKENLLSVSEKQTGTYIHAEQLHLLIQSAIEQAGITVSDIDAVAVSIGPGSYTGLRIGLSAAKGLCYALDIPMIAVSTLQVLAKQIETRDTIYSVIDARRDEVYGAMYDADCNQLKPPKAEVITHNSYVDFLKDRELIFVGTAADKCERILAPHPNLSFVKAYPSAQELALLAYNRYQQAIFEDIAYIEPIYLKEFIAG